MSLPSGLSPWNPAAILSTWFWSGLLPKAPGSWGSLFTLPFAWVIALHWGTLGLLLAATITFAVGIWSTSVFLAASTHKDPGAVVIDETAGQLLCLAAVPLDIWWYAAGFVAFRLADIFKFWPASWADRSLPGALSVMTDDIFAAVYAGAALYFANRLIEGSL